MRIAPVILDTESGLPQFTLLGVTICWANYDRSEHGLEVTAGGRRLLYVWRSR